MNWEIPRYPPVHYKLPPTVVPVSQKLKRAACSSLQIYPNPVENEFFIEGITGAPQIRLQIISAQGQLVQDRKLTSLSEAINVSDLPQGIYIIRCISEQNIRSQKIIKK